MESDYSSATFITMMAICYPMVLIISSFVAFFGVDEPKEGGGWQRAVHIGFLFLMATYACGHIQNTYVIGFLNAYYWLLNLSSAVSLWVAISISNDISYIAYETNVNQAVINRFNSLRPIERITDFLQKNCHYVNWMLIACLGYACKMHVAATAYWSINAFLILIVISMKNDILNGFGNKKANEAKD